jgi:hypothetical protein
MMRRVRGVMTAVVAATAILTPVARARVPGLPVVSCGALQRIDLGDGRTSCTHGPDPAPPGVDPSVPQPLASSQPTFSNADSASATGTIPCYGDGVTGKRVQAMYVRPC